MMCVFAPNESQMTIDKRLTEIVQELVSSGITLEQAVEAFETKYISIAMDRTEGNVTQASKILGIHRNTLHNKLRTHGEIAAYQARSGSTRARTKRRAARKKK